MALTQGHEVAYIQPDALASYSERNGDFVFGVIIAVTSPTDIDVLWSNGTRTDGLPGGQLDRIVGQDDTSLEGKVVRITGADSPEMSGIVIRSYTRDPDDVGSPTSYSLVQLLSTGRLVEVLTSQLTAVTGR